MPEAAAAAKPQETLIVDQGDTYQLPDITAVATFSLAKAGQLMDELVSTGLIDAPPEGFAKLGLPEKRDALVSLLKQLSGGGDTEQELAGEAQAHAKQEAEAEAKPEAKPEEKAPAKAKAEAKPDKAKPKPKDKAKPKPNAAVAELPKTPDADDPIMKFAAKIEKVTDRGELETMLVDLAEQSEQNEFYRGGVFARLQSNPKLWNESYASFKDYVETSPSISCGYRKAMYMIEMYTDMLKLDVSWAEFGGIGWTKVLKLLKVLKVVGKEHLVEWVEKAKHMSAVALQAHVDEALKPKDEKGAPVADVSTMSFKVHKDQKEIISSALDKAKKAVNTEVQTVALEAICQDYMGSGIAFKDWKEALAYARKSVPAEEAVNFAAAVVEALEKLCPELKFGDLSVDVKEAA